MGQGSERREDKGKHQKPAVDDGIETKKIENEAEVKEEEGRRGTRILPTWFPPGSPETNGETESQSQS